MCLLVSCHTFSYSALSLPSLLVVDDEDNLATFFIDLFNDNAHLSHDNTDGLRWLHFFLVFMYSRLLRASLEDEFQPDGGSMGGEMTRCFSEFFTPCFKIMGAYQAMDNLTEVSFATVAAIIANDFGAVAACFIASSKNSQMHEESSRMEASIPLKALSCAAMIKALL